MNDDPSPPPARELPRERLEARKHHLLSEIARAQRPSLIARTRWSPRLNSGAFVATTALVVVAVAVGLLVTRGGTSTASAAEVRMKLAEGLRFRQSVSGEFAVRTQRPGRRPRGVPGCLNCTPAVPQPSRFVIGADGSYSSLTLPLEATRRDDVAYDARTGIETSFGRFADPRTRRPLYIRATNLDPASLTSGPEAQLGAWVLGALADRDPRVRNTTFDGRPAWEVTVTFIPGEYLYDVYGARVDVVVDQATGLVLQVTQYAYDTERWTSIRTVQNLRIGAPTRREDFTVPKPASALEVTHDFAFRRVAPSAAAAVVGYSALLPAETLGRERSDFAVAKTTNLGPPGFPFLAFHDVVSARYGDGPDSITVSTRRGRLDELLTNTALGGARPVHPSGLLRGDDAYVSTDPLRRSLFAAFHRGLLVQITAPSARDAIRVAESLRAVG
jgi:hypothetical protein